MTRFSAVELLLALKPDRTPALHVLSKIVNGSLTGQVTANVIGL